jgi:hypothetical protein
LKYGTLKVILKKMNIQSIIVKIKNLGLTKKIISISKMSSNDLKEIFLSKIGSTLLYDSLYLFLIVPMSVIGTILNIISLIIFFRKNMRNLSFYKYYQIYAINSLILSFTLSLNFLHSPRFFFDLSISRAARIFKCLIELSYVLPLALFYSNAMNILLNIERATCFTTKFKYFKNTSPYLICFWLLLICTIVNMPAYFLIRPASDKEINDALTNLTGSFKSLCLRNNNILKDTIFGIVITLFGIIIKGLFTLIIDIASNFISIYYFKKYLQKKIISFNLNNELLTSIIQMKRMESMKRKQTMMTIYLTTFSIIISIVELSANVIIFFFSKNFTLLYVIEFLVCFLIAFKQIMNFFFYYWFNSNFKIFLNKVFKISFRIN